MVIAGHTPTHRVASRVETTRATTSISKVQRPTRVTRHNVISGSLELPEQTAHRSACAVSMLEDTLPVAAPASAAAAATKLLAFSRVINSRDT